MFAVGDGGGDRLMQLVVRFVVVGFVVKCVRWSCCLCSLLIVLVAMVC